MGMDYTTPDWMRHLPYEELLAFVKAFNTLSRGEVDSVAADELIRESGCVPPVVA